MLETPSVDFGNKILGTPGVTMTFTIRTTGTGPLSITGVSTTGGNSSDFTVNTSALPPSIAGGAQTNVIVTFNPTTPGLRTTTLRVLSNDAAKGTIDVALSGRLLTAIQNWRQIYFGSIANSGNGADLNDYKKDGKVNLLKYAFGLNPTLSNVGQIPQPQKVGTDFVASFTQPNGVSGITYGAEWSTTLLDGSWTPIPDTGFGAQHTFSLAIGTMPKLFLRLTVTDPGTPISLAGAVATHSSGYGADGYPASNAIDGDPYSFTATGNTDPAPTWTLTLPVATEIGSIVLSNRLGCCGERLRNITVRVFSDAAGTVPVFTSAVLNPNNVLNSPPTLSVSPGGVTGRVIRVSRGLSDNPVGDDRVLSLGEVQLTSP